MINIEESESIRKILQKNFITKTFIRNEEWDVIWFLGGRNDVTIGEKDNKFFLFSSNIEREKYNYSELMQENKNNTITSPILLRNKTELELVLSGF